MADTEGTRPDASPRSHTADEDTETSSRQENSADDCKDRPVTLEQFRILLGICPVDRAHRAAKGKQQNTGGSSVSHRTISDVDTPGCPWKIFPQWRFWWHFHSCDDVESNIGLYASICREEYRTRCRYIAYNVFLYVALVVQLVISHVLVILGALSQNFHIVIAVLGAINGVLTGMLGLMRGQGLPARLMKYEHALQVVRREIEWQERDLEAGVKIVTFGDVHQLFRRYEQVKKDAQNNHPDTWSTGGLTTGTAIAAPTPSQMPATNQNSTTKGR